MSGDAAAAAERVVPDRFRGPESGRRATFRAGGLRPGAQRRAAAIEPRLVELQAFPSLYGFQLALAEAYRRRFGLPPGASSTHLGGLTRDEYLRARCARRSSAGTIRPKSC